MKLAPLIFVFLLAQSLGIAQNTIFVRSAGNDTNSGSTESAAKKTIVAAVAAAEAGDIIDIGPGLFTGGKLSKGVVLQGANANYDIARWDKSTVITSTIDISSTGSGAVITLVGLEFGAGTPLAGTAENASITIYNCKFLGSAPIVTKGSKWAELFLTASILDGQPDVKADTAKPGKSKGAVAAQTSRAKVSESALVGGDVGVLVFRENIVRNYGRSAIDLSGSGQIVRISYNEFSTCNSSGDSAHAAIRLEVSGIEQEATVENCLFTSCATSVAVSGNNTQKQVRVFRNSFRKTPDARVALRSGTVASLEAPCNAFNVLAIDGDKAGEPDAMKKLVQRLISGPASIEPMNISGIDKDGDSIGFEPDAASGCMTKE